MRAFLAAWVAALVSVLRSRASPRLEILGLRHQLAVLQEGGGPFGGPTPALA